jgi:ribosomal protein L37AE/L43A
MLKDRLRAAFRLLTKRGDDAVACSFCGSGRYERDRIIAGPGVAICWECARLAADSAYDSVVDPATVGTTRITIAPVLAPGEKLTAQQRSTLHETLGGQAAEHGCELRTWHYVCGHETIGGYLGFDVTCATDVEATPLQLKLKASCRRAFGLSELS